MNKVYLGLGSNMGDREQLLKDAISEIETNIGNITNRSSFYETAPWGYISENSFLNMALCVETTCDAVQILNITQQIERHLGRSAKSNVVYSDRPIDIDLLFFNDEIIRTDNLLIPHPLIQERLFVLEPLSEFAPSFRHPVLGKTVRELLDMLNDNNVGAKKECI